MEKAPELAWPNSGDGSAATNANEKESQPTSSRVSAGELPAAAGKEGKVEGKKPPQPVRSSGGVLKSRPLLRAVKNTFRDLVPGLGGHNSFGVTAAECAALPHLDPAHPNQHAWLDFLVWRKFMATAAVYFACRHHLWLFCM